ncbi:NAD kinase [Calidifontibacter terrae]
MTRRVLLIGHPGRPRAAEVAATLVDELNEHGLQVVGAADELGAFGLLGRANVSAEPDADGTGCELAVVLGGDGTILRAAELVRESGTPLLGVNLGHVGFLAEAEPDNIHHIARRIVDASWSVEERETLEVDVHVDGEIVWQSWALNEASVEKIARERMIELVVEIDGRPLSTWSGDGVVMATPTGSTAYAFSAGGPVIWPGVEALLLCPISAHALFARPLVLGHEVRIAVELIAESAGRAVVWCDGRRNFDLPRGARIGVRRSPVPVRLARIADAPFTDRLVAKFDLSVHGWRGAREDR